MLSFSYLSFFFNDTATTEIYTLSLHDALPILGGPAGVGVRVDAQDAVQAALDAEVARRAERAGDVVAQRDVDGDRKSTRLNSSHANISYAVFCLKKKIKKKKNEIMSYNILHSN